MHVGTNVTETEGTAALAETHRKLQMNAKKAGIGEMLLSRLLPTFIGAALRDPYYYDEQVFRKHPADDVVLSESVLKKETCI